MAEKAPKAKGLGVLCLHWFDESLDPFYRHPRLGTKCLTWLPRPRLANLGKNDRKQADNPFDEPPGVPKFRSLPEARSNALSFPLPSLGKSGSGFTISIDGWFPVMSPVPDSPQPVTPKPSLSQPKVPKQGTRRGRSRDEQSRESIHAATRKLALSSPRYRELSIERIASEANASKATIYRWWDSKADLVCEACLVEPISAAPGVSLEGDLNHLAREQVRVYQNAASAPVFAGAWAELVENRENSPERGEQVRCPQFEQTTAMLSQAFERARVRGEWQGPYNAEDAFDILSGQLLYLLIGRAAEVTDQRIDRIVQHMLLAAQIAD